MLEILEAPTVLVANRAGKHQRPWECRKSLSLSLYRAPHKDPRVWFFSRTRIAGRSHHTGRKRLSCGMHANSTQGPGHPSAGDDSMLYVASYPALNYMSIEFK